MCLKTTTREQVYQNYLGFLLSGQRVNCASVINGLLADQVPARQIHLDIFQTSMYEVGELWAANQISVATEHMASAITEGLLNEVFSNSCCQPPTGRKAVVAGIQPELHQLGSRIVADTLEISGWESLFVGANLPTADLLRMIHETNPDLVAITLTMYSNQPALRAAIDEIQRGFPSQRIIVGGKGVSGGIPCVHENDRQVTHVPSLDELDVFLGQFQS